MILAVLLGAGTQVLGIFYTVLASTIEGTYSVLNLGVKITLLVALVPFFSLINGYVAARMYRFWNGSNWIILATCASVALPGFSLGCLFVIDICEYVETKQPGLLPISDLFVLLFLWLLLNCPVTFAGAFYGFSE